jgi:hypothetical protein
VVVAALPWLTAAIGSAQTGAIPAVPVRCADCALTGQNARPVAFDAAAVTFVKETAPFLFENRGVRIVLIGRVLRPSPLIIDILDAKLQAVDSSANVTQDDLKETGHRGLCGVQMFSNVDARSEATVRTLAFNDLITATMAALPIDLTVSDVRKASGPVAPFHTGADVDACVNHTGRLAHYRGLEGQDLTIFNDGRMEYRALGAYLSERETLSAGERAALLRAFATINFDRLPDTLPKPAGTPEPSITLSAMRYQRVALDERVSAVAPLVAQLEAAARKAHARARYRLSPGRRSPATIVPWPVPDVDLRQFYVLAEAAAQQRAQGAGNVPGDFEALRQSAPAAIPLYHNSIGAGTDPHKHTFFSQNGKLFRVERAEDCGRGTGICRVMDLIVEEMLPGGASLELPGVAPYTRGRLTRGPLGSIVARPGSPDGAIVVRQPPFAWMWPADAGLALSSVRPDGTIVGGAAFDRHRSHYASLLKGGPYGNAVNGLNFVEGNFIYEGVKLCHIAPGSRADACEVRP